MRTLILIVFDTVRSTLLIGLVILGGMWYWLARAQPVREQAVDNQAASLPDAVTTPFQLLEPPEGLVTTKDSIVVSGRADPGQFVLIFASIGETQVDQAGPDGVFSAELALAEGPNSVGAAVFPPTFYALDRQRIVIRRTTSLSPSMTELLGEVRHVGNGELQITVWAGPNVGKLTTVDVRAADQLMLNLSSLEPGAIVRIVGRLSEDRRHLVAASVALAQRPETFMATLYATDSTLVVQPRESWREPVTLDGGTSPISVRVFMPADGELVSADRSVLELGQRVLVTAWHDEADQPNHATSTQIIVIPKSGES